MGKPTKAQLEKINKFTSRPLTEDEVYVFEPLMIDDQKTSHYSVIHTNLLKKFVKDTKRGVPLLMNHNSFQLPVGRSFDARLTNEFDDELSVDTKSVYGSFYIDLGRNTESNMTTDDITRGIDAGTIFDVSIGFSAKSWKCSICGNDIRNYMQCPHIPGRVYEVEGEDGVLRNVECNVIVGEDGVGELLELSLVYAGACSRATIKNFSNDVRDFENGTKLSLVDDFKNIPLDATIYQYYTKDGSILWVDTDERTNGREYLNQRSEEKVNLSGIIKTTLGIEFNDETELNEKLSELMNKLNQAQEDLTTKDAELAKVNEELANATAEVEMVKEALAKKDETIAELEKTNEELSEKAQIAETYRQDLINETIELGIAVNGNAFQTDLFKRFLGTLSLDELKQTRDSFKTDLDNKYPVQRVTESDNALEDRLSEVAPDEDDEKAFRDFVAEKAMEYAKENKVSIAEATKIMYKKYKKEVDD